MPPFTLYTIMALFHLSNNDFKCLQPIFGVILFYFHLNHDGSQREFLPHIPLLDLTWTFSTFQHIQGLYFPWKK